MDMDAPLHLPKPALEDLISLLWREGFKVVGPIAHDHGVNCREVKKVSDMAVGLRDEQEPGRYQLMPGIAREIFGIVNGAGSLKPFFLTPEEILPELTVKRRGFQSGNSWTFCARDCRRSQRVMTRPSKI